MTTVHIVGGGLAGCEAAWQCLKSGQTVILYEMHPKQQTPAHQSGDLAELVCSNTFKSMDAHSAPGELKWEMEQLDSLIIRTARQCAIPAGQALGVDRLQFARAVSMQLAAQPRFTRVTKEVLSLPTPEEFNETGERWIIATGPLTSESMAQAIVAADPNQHDRLFFYDAIAPIISTESIDFEQCFFANRYDDDSDDYLNIPLDKPGYEAFVDAILAAEKMPLHHFETTQYFEACLPIEVMAERGKETLRFGPMKPVGLTNPKTGRWPYAAIQLRRENACGTMFSMVGFQTKMKWPEQERIFRTIPALANAEFLRLGSVHRNTYVHGPRVLNPELALNHLPFVHLAGQVTGVEGYTESAAIGLLAGRFAAGHYKGQLFTPPPADTMMGALYHYVTKGGLGSFQPMNANLGLLPPVVKRKGLSKIERKRLQTETAKSCFTTYLSAQDLTDDRSEIGGFKGSPPNQSAIDIGLT